MSPGAPVVLVHGLGVDHRMWALQVPFLQDLGPLWAPDLPGFGETPPAPPGRCGVSAYADLVAAGIRERYREPVRLAGYSMGGTIALLVALRHPELVGALGVCCSSPCWGRGLRRWAALAFARIGRRGAMEVFQLSVLWAFSRYSRDPEAAAVVRDMVRRAHRPTMLRLYTDLARTDLRGSLGAVRAPTLAVAGTRDWLAPPSHARILVREVPAAELELVRGADHMLCMARPGELGEALRGFFLRAGRRARQAVGEPPPAPEEEAR